MYKKPNNKRLNDIGLKKMTGVVEIYDSSGKLVEKSTNEINRRFRERVLDLINNQPNTITNITEYNTNAVRKIRFAGIAFGTDDTASAVSDSALGNESLRKELSSRSRAIQGSYLAVGTLATDELNNVNIREIGLLLPTNTGDTTLANLVLGTRANVNFTKSSGEYTINYFILW